MENPIKIDDLGGKPPIFGNTQINQFQNAKFPHFFSPAFSSIGTPETSRPTKKESRQIGEGKTPWALGEPLNNKKRSMVSLDEWFIPNNIFLSFFLKDDLFFALSKPKPWEWMCFFLRRFWC